MADNEHLVAGLHSRGVLPHLKREGGTYFVTFRQAGTLPKEVLLQFKQEREAILQQAEAAKRPLTWHEQEELFRWYSSRVDKHLDAGHGICHLRDPELATIMAGAIQFFEGQRYELRAWVVMPNHVHVVVWPKPPQTLSAILHSWKSYSAHEINHRLPAPVVPFWQGESYDHLIRDEDDLHRCCHYTLMNPVNAGLCARMEDWEWSSAYVAQPSAVAQPSSAAGSGTVPVRVSGTGGGTPLHPQAGTPALRLDYDRSPAISISRQQAGAGTVDSAISAHQDHAAGGAVLRFRRVVHRHGGARAGQGILAE